MPELTGHERPCATHTLGIQSNSDGAPVATRHQAETYCCKYSSKHTKRLGQRTVLYDVLDDMIRKDASKTEKRRRR